MKRFLFFTMLLVMTLTSASAYDFSYTNTFVNDDGQEMQNTLFYALNEDGNTVTVVAGPEKYQFAVTVIPETVEFSGKTYSVTIIGNQAFAGGKIGRLTMANTIENIQTKAFMECAVDSVSFSKGLKVIGDDAFYRATLISVYLYEGVTTVGQNAFATNSGYNSGKIRVAELPESLTDLGQGAFDGQQDLSVVKLPSGLKELKSSVFAYCNSLTTIALPAGLEKIGDGTFYSAGITEITFPSSLKEIGGAAFYRANLIHLELPNSVETIGGINNMYGVFEGNFNLESCKLSSRLKIIPENAFSDCGKLVEVQIPEGITRIGKGAFSYCTLLSSINLPEGLTDLDWGVFDGAGLQTVSLPSTLTYLGDYMFNRCESLSSLTIPSSIKEIKDGAFSGCTNLTSVTIPETVKSIGKSAFSGTGLTEVTLPVGLTILSDGTFENCERLQKVTLPEGLSEIGNHCFRDCETLTDIVMPKSLTIAYDDVFQDCLTLKELTFSSALESWGSSVFQGCSALTAVHINRAIPPVGNNRYGYKDVIGTNNQCILYVPTGSKALYEQTDGYKNFMEIREENVDGTIFYQVATLVTNGEGRVLVNGDYNYDGKYEVARQNNVTLTFKPAEGWMLNSVSVNGKDVTADVADNQLTLTAVETNIAAEVVFAEKPVLLTIKTGDGGTVGISVEKGKAYTCVLKPEEGWEVNTVMFDGIDVTSQVTEDNVFVTPQLRNDALLTVSFENSTSAIRSLAAASDMKAYVNADGYLCVDGTMAGERVLITAADGRQLLDTKSNGGRISLPLAVHTIYVVSTEAKTVKVIF